MVSGKNIPALLLIGGFLLLASYIIFAFDGTGDAGDSVYHFLIAQGAPTHPDLFFDHWGKPFFTLLASPFAQFGFNGIQVFNVLLLALTVGLTIKTAQQLGFTQAIWSGLFVLAAPYVLRMVFSGLTEYLFGAILIAGIWLVLKKRYTWSAILVSFLPFVRSEGLIIIGVFGLFFLVEKRYRTLLWLALGHVVYGVAGLSVHGSIWWVLGDIPYATPGSVYGSGTAFHFVEQLFYLAGPILFGLWAIGLIAYFAKTKTYQPSNRVESILIVGGFLAYFIAHSIFWYFGIFNSMGLKRVLIAVMPLCAIIALNGWQSLLQLERRLWPRAYFSQYAIILAVLILPFTGNKAALQIPTDFERTADQHLLHDAAAFIAAYNLRQPGTRIFYAAPYAAIALNIDHFAANQHLPLDQYAIQNLRPGDLVIWDSWFAPIDNAIHLDPLKENFQLQERQRFSAPTPAGTTTVVILTK
jgi:hypothetical protein